MPRKRIQAGPGEDDLTLVKTIVIAHAGRNFVNGDQEFDLTRKDIDTMIRNFNHLKNQVPLMFGEHGFGGDRGSVPAAGWVLSLGRDGDEFMATVKLHGEGARSVMSDEFRGISIGTKPGVDLQGQPIGDLLDHLLITNAPFFADLNIAAARRNEPAVRYITAQRVKPMSRKNKKARRADATILPPDEKLDLHPETELDEHDDDENTASRRKATGHPDDDEVAARRRKAQDDEDDEIAAQDDEDDEKVARRGRRAQDDDEEEPTVELIRSLRNQIIRLKARLLEREASLERRASSPGNANNEGLALQVARQGRTIMAQQVRELVTKGIEDGKLRPSWVRDSNDDTAHDPDGVTLDWLLASRFVDEDDPGNKKAALKMLRYCVRNNPSFVKVGQEYPDGRPTPSGREFNLTAEQKHTLRRQGINPDRLSLAAQSTGFEDYRQRRALTQGPAKRKG